MRSAPIVIRMLSFFTSPNKEPEPVTLAAGPASTERSASRRITQSTLDFVDDEKTFDPDTVYGQK